MNILSRNYITKLRDVSGQDVQDNVIIAMVQISKNYVNSQRDIELVVVVGRYY
jgi:hypothetical protein